MAVSLVRVDQIHKPDSFDDSLSASAIANSESNDVDYADHNNARLSQIKRIIHGGVAGNWHDDVTTLGSGADPDASLLALVNRLRLQDKLILKYRLNITDVTVPAAQNWVVFTAAGELPDKNIAIANTVQGAVCSQLGGAVGSHSLIENSGLTAVRPKNLVQVFDGSTGDEIVSDGRRVFALLQVGAAATDNVPFQTSGNDQGQLSFVRINATADDLEAVPVADIQGKVINYAFSNRDDLADMPEEAFRGELDTAQGVQGAVSLDQAYNGGYFMEVDGTDVDIRLADAKSWVFRKGSGGVTLLTISRNDAGTDEIDIGGNVDLFDCNAADNDFAEGMTVDSAGQAINIGKTALGVIDSTSIETRATTGDNIWSSVAGDAKYRTVRETTALPMDDATAGAISALPGGPHASVSAAILHAISTGGIGLYFKTFTAGSNYNQGVNIPGATLDLSTFTIDANTPANTDAFVFLNGRLLYGGNVSVKNDVYVGDTPASGDIKVDFPKGIKTGDVILTIGLQ